MTMNISNGGGQVQRNAKIIQALHDIQALGERVIVPGHGGLCDMVYIRRLNDYVQLLYGTMAVIVIWSMTVDTSHAHTWVEKYIPGFWAIFGLGSCTVLIFFARWFGSAGIEREEDYYDD